MTEKLRVGISACLLGDEVPWNGGHERSAPAADVLGPHVSWIRVCPELEIGLGVPREPANLVRVGGDVPELTQRVTTAARFQRFPGSSGRVRPRPSGPRTRRAISFSAPSSPGT